MDVRERTQNDSGGSVSNTTVSVDDLRLILDSILRTRNGAESILCTDASRAAFYRLGGALTATPKPMIVEAPIYLGILGGDMNKINLIKVVRAETGLGLREAKLWVEGRDLPCSVKMAEALWQAGGRIKWPEGYPVSYRDVGAGQNAVTIDSRDPDRW